MISHLLKNRYIHNLNLNMELTDFVFFQNPMLFNYTSFYVEDININDMLVYARKRGNRNYYFMKIARIGR